jgi:choline-sulfatase
MVFSEIAWSDEIAGCMVRTGDWKYCYYIDGSEELYNLILDPDEVRNLARQKDKSDIKKTLRSAVMEFWQPDELEYRRNRLGKCPDKNLQGVASQYCLPDGTWADAWP